MDDRSAKINIGGREFELILTTRATKEIAGRYGGLENLGQKLMRSENFEMALDELVWLITLLANQSVRGGLADAVRFSSRPVGMPQTVPRHGKAETGTFHRRYYPARTVRRRST